MRVCVCVCWTLVSLKDNNSYTALNNLDKIEISSVAF